MPKLIVLVLLLFVQNTFNLAHRALSERPQPVEAVNCGQGRVAHQMGVLLVFVLQNRLHRSLLTSIQVQPLSQPADFHLYRVTPVSAASAPDRLAGSGYGRCGAQSTSQ